MRAFVRGVFAGLMLIVLPLMALIVWSQGEGHPWSWAWRECVLATWEGR